MKKKTIIIVAIIIAAIILSAFIFFIIKLNDYKNRVALDLQSQLNKKVKIGRITPIIRPYFGIGLKDVIIQQQDKSSSEPLFYAHFLKFKINPRLILSGNIKVDSIRIEGFTFNINNIRDLVAILPLKHSISGNIQKSPKAERIKEPSKLRLNILPDISFQPSRFNLFDGEMRYFPGEEWAGLKAPVILKKINGDITYESPGRTVLFNVTSYIDRWPDKKITFSGNLKNLIAGEKQRFDLDLNLKINNLNLTTRCNIIEPFTDNIQLTANLEKFSLEGLSSLFPSLIKNSAGDIRFNLNYGYLTKKDITPAIAGDLNISRVKIGFNNGSIPDIDRLDGRLKFSSTGIDLPYLDLKIGHSDISFRGYMYNYNSPRVRFVISSAFLDLGDFLSPGMIFSEHVKERKKEVRSKPKSTPLISEKKKEDKISRILDIRNIRADGRVNIAKGRMHKVDFGKASAHVMFNQGIVVIQNIRINSGSDSYIGYFKTDFTQNPPRSSIFSKIYWHNADSIISSLTGLENFITGAMSFDTSIQWNGLSIKNARMNGYGKGVLSIRDGKLTDKKIIKELLKTGIFLENEIEKDNGLGFSELFSNIVIRDGQIIVKNMRLVSKKFLLTSEGFIRFDGKAGLIFRAISHANIQVKGRAGGDIKNLSIQINK